MFANWSNARKAGNFVLVAGIKSLRRRQSQALVSVCRKSLVPFLEHYDANRSVMVANMPTASSVPRSIASADLGNRDGRRYRHAIRAHSSWPGATASSMSVDSDRIIVRVRRRPGSKRMAEQEDRQCKTQR